MDPALSQAAAQVFDPFVLLVICCAAAYGVFMGAVPGLTATMAVALLVPVTFFLDPVPAIAAVVTLEACAIFAGDIPTTLLRIPGTPASAAYADDAYALTKAGQPQRALGIALFFSVIGGLFGAVVLVTSAQSLARVATEFSAAEYFWLYMLGLSCAVVVSRGSVPKALLALLIGLLLSTVGQSSVYASSRFTFGRPELYEGINFIPAMIGLFGLSEVFRNLGHLNPAVDEATATRRERDSVFSALREIPRRLVHTLRSGVLGSLIGMLPGAGGDIGAWVSLAASKKFSPTPEEYGRGSTEALADATTANSAALAGAWIPALVFGVPGDTITAIVIGVLMMKNVTPGPAIFANDAPLVYSIYLTFAVANLVLIPIGITAIKLGSYIVHLPQRVLLPLILVFCVLGAYAIGSNYFDIGVMLAMGILGFLLERREVPLAPVVLGIILGGPLEEKFVQVMTGSDANLLAFVDRRLSAPLGMLCLVLWAWPLVRWWRSR